MNQEYIDVIEYLSLGINIFSDFRRHLFSSDARFAEVPVCRAEECEWFGGFASCVRLARGNMWRICISNFWRAGLYKSFQ